MFWRRGYGRGWMVFAGEFLCVISGFNLFLVEVGLEMDYEERGVGIVGEWFLFL